MIEMTFNQALILLPMLAVVALTIIGFARLVVVRFTSIRARQTPLKYYVAFQNASEPENVAVAVRHYANLFEAPIIFYAACVTVFALQAVTPSIYYAAWAYAVFRIAQSTIHLTFNNVRYRAYAFLLGWIALIALWGQIASAVFAKLA
jgi:hypothetical protein